MQNFDFWSDKTPFSIFVDPATHLGFAGDIYHRGLQPHSADQDDPDGTLVKPYIDRLKQVCSFYAHLADVGDIRDEAGTYYTGWTGFIEAHAAIPPEDRRNVMIEVQEKWALNALTSPNFYETNINPANVAGVTFGYGQDTFYYDPANASGITLPAIPEEWRNDTSAIAEFSRQAGMGVPYLSGGLTPGSEGTTMGTFKSVAKRFYNDLAEYLRSRGTDNIIHYSSFGTDLLDGNTGGASVPKIGLRSDLASGGKSWWRRSFWHPNLSDSMTYAEEKGILRDLADASLSADMYGGSVLNWCPNIGSDIAYAWYAPVDRLVDAGGGLSSVTGSKFSLNDLSYWAARGSAALMHEFYGYADSLATSLSNSSYRKGLSMIIQLDSPVVAQAGALGGGAFAAQKWGYMKDPDLAADIDIFGAFGATDANVPDMRKPDQIWVRSSSLYNNKLLFESGTGNYADASSLGYPDDNFTAHFAVLTARSQLEKRLFKRDMMEENEAIFLDNSNQFTPNEFETQEDRLQWLEQNTLPNVYWDARVGEQYSEGSSNNVRFWSAATGNCLPAPCVFDGTSPIARYLNSNNDIYKNDVRVAIKKWISEQQTSAIETAYQKLSSIYFTPTVQGDLIPLFVDPWLMSGWRLFEADAFGATATEYRNRILKVATPYTYVSSGRCFQPYNYYTTEQRNFDLFYGLSSNSEHQVNSNGTPASPQNIIYPDGMVAGYYLPPISSRAVMYNSEYPWLVVLNSRRPDSYCCGDSTDDNVFSQERNTPGVIAEFARQAAMGPSVAPYLFPEGHPEGGLTPGSSQSTLGTWRRVCERQWEDLSKYALGDGSYSASPKARHVIHYAGGIDGGSKFRVARAGIRRTPTTTRSYWQRNSSARDFLDVYEFGLSSSDPLRAIYNAQRSASALDVSFYSYYPSHPDSAVGATFWYSDFNAGERKSPTGGDLSTDFSFADLLYWQTKEHATSIGYLDRGLNNNGFADRDNPPKYAATTIPMLTFAPTQDINYWIAGRKDPRIAARYDTASFLATTDSNNPVMKRADSVWIWDAIEYYWLRTPTLSTYTPANLNSGPQGNPPTEWPNYSEYWQKRALGAPDGGLTLPSVAGGMIGDTMYARYGLEVMLFGRPEYPTELLQKMESDGISSENPIAPNTVNRVTSDIRARTGQWFFENSLTDGWWVSNTGYRHAENRVWYDPIISLQVTSGEERVSEDAFTVGSTAYFSYDPVPTQENALAIGYVTNWTRTSQTEGSLGLSGWILGSPCDVAAGGNIVVTGDVFQGVIQVQNIISGGCRLPSPCVLDQNSPLAPWLNFTSEIRTTDVLGAMRNYLSDHACQYVEEMSRILRNEAARRR